MFVFWGRHQIIPFFSCHVLNFINRTPRTVLMLNKMSSAFFMRKLMDEQWFWSLVKRVIAAKRTNILFSWNLYFKVIKSIYLIYWHIQIHIGVYIKYICHKIEPQYETLYYKILWGFRHKKFEAPSWTNKQTYFERNKKPIGNMAGRSKSFIVFLFEYVCVYILIRYMFYFPRHHGGWLFFIRLPL